MSEVAERRRRRYRRRAEPGEDPPPSSKKGIKLMREIAREKNFPELEDLADAIKTFIPALKKRPDKRTILRPLVRDAGNLLRELARPRKPARSARPAADSD